MARTPVGPGSWEASQLPLDVSGIQCDSGHLNPSGATYCGTCGLGLGPAQESAVVVLPASKGLAGRLRGAIGRWSEKRSK